MTVYPQRRALGFEQRHLRRRQPSCLYDKHHRVRPAADFPFIDYGLMAFARRTVADEIPAAGKADLADLLHALSRPRRAGRDGGRRAFLRDRLARGAGGLRAMAARTTLIVLDRDGVLNALLPNPDEPRPDSPMRPSEVTVFPWVPDVDSRSDAGRVRHRHRQQSAGVGEGEDDARRAAGGARGRRRGRSVGGRHHPELAHLLSPRRGQVRAAASPRPACWPRRLRSTRATTSPRRGWRAIARRTSWRAPRSG